MKNIILMSVVILLSACSDSKRIEPIVNAPPQISSVSDQQISANQSAAPITINASDDVTQSSNLQVIINSSNQSLIRDEDLILTGFNGAIAELTITPVTGQIGSTSISVSVTDFSGANATINFNVSVVNQRLSADMLIRNVFVNDKNAAPVSLDAIELIQDVNDENQYNDLIGSSM